MSTHKRLSPSAAPRYSRCYGSVREEAKYPNSGSNAASIDGTHTHTLLETVLNSDRGPEEWIGIRLTDHDGEFVVNADRAARVRVAIDFIDGWVNEFMKEGRVEIKAERKVNPEFLLGRSDMSGTVDVTIEAFGARELMIIDYKDGINPVPIDTEQLELYAVGVLAGYKLPINVEYPFDFVRLVIIQPKLALKGLPPVDSRLMSVKDVLDLAGKYAAIGANIDDPNAPLTPGDIQCKYCKAKGNCSALTNHVMQGVNVMSQINVAQQAADKDPAEMSDDQIREILEAAPLLKQLLEAVDKEALRRFQSGRSIPGFKLVHGRGSSDWSLPEEEMAEKLIKLGIPKGSVYVTKLISPTQAKKVTWEKRDGTKKQLTDRQIKMMESEYIAKSQGKLTVVPESDSRQAITFSAESLFSPVNNDVPDWLK